ncbi:hypothetical protein [Pseudomonas juntendi]|uniref:hypothetical protein n=1 Tax=Pseudomonas juntendi TaxID=2666183 RepID=UPI001E643CFC|nr:hypothetical protein [Pseudomonas juntendi]MDH0042415.1 hypothetical protein [Pseudomonas juntendi]MDM3889633.1 hypothetical protein [Pseudomonas juntendi]
MKKPPLAERAVAAVARYERAAAELTNIKRAIVAELDKCPITIEAFSDSGMESFDRGHSLLWDGTRPNTHLHRALTNTVSDYCSERRLDQEEISDQLTGWDDDDPDACPHCLAAWNLILSRKAARAEFGQAKRLIRALGKLAIQAEPAEPERSCAAKECQRSRVEGTMFCSEHQSVKDRWPQRPITNEQLSHMMQQDGYQQ